MSDNPADPSGSTQAFRAFSQAAPEDPPAASRAPVIIGAVAVVALLVALIVWLAAS